MKLPLAALLALFISGCALPTKVGTKAVYGSITDAQEGGAVRDAFVVVHYSSISVVSSHWYEQGTTFSDSTGVFDVPAKPAITVQSSYLLPGPSVIVVHPCYGYVATFGFGGELTMPMRLEFKRLAPGTEPSATIPRDECERKPQQTCATLKSTLSSGCAK